MPPCRRVLVSHRKAVPVCVSLASEKEFLGELLLTQVWFCCFLLPNPPLVLLFDEGLQCRAASSAAQPCEQRSNDSEQSFGGELEIEPSTGLSQVL